MPVLCRGYYKTCLCISRILFNWLEIYIKDNYISYIFEIGSLGITPFLYQKAGVKLDKMSPIERRKLENEIEMLRLENEKLRGIIGSVLAEVSKIIGDLATVRVKTTLEV